MRQRALSHISRSIWTFISLGVVVALAVAAIYAAPADATDNQLITVFADGQERTIRTSVATVQEALDKAEISLEESDIVEPALDTIIVDPTFRINIYRARPVTVVDGGSEVHVVSPYQSARLIAAQAGVTLYPEDNFTIERIDDILESGAIGQRLVIDRATPITIDLYGNTFTLRTHEATLGEAIAQRNITVSENDIVSPSLDTKVTENLDVEVVHVGTEVVSVEEPAPFATETIRDSNRYIGEREVTTPGVAGIKLSTYEIELHDGEEQVRNLLQTVIIQEPVDEVVVVGTRVLDPSSNTAIGQEMAAARGWVDDQWLCLYNLWTRESNWNHLAKNPSSSAYGIPQSLPGTKMASVADDWLTNPRTQIEWGLNYIGARYGAPCNAWGHSEIHNWY